jgi:hypothetical protein
MLLSPWVHTLMDTDGDARGLFLLAWLAGNFVPIAKSIIDYDDA